MTEGAEQTHERDRSARRPIRRAKRFTACDANVRAKAGSTSCPFAQNVFYEFWKAGADREAVTAYSPVTKQDYDLDCVTGTTIVCRGGDGSEVRFRMAAVDAYDAQQAYDYACSHTVAALESGCPEKEPRTFAPAAAASGGEECDPNYAGECLDRNSSDYDCEGGEGDGPDFVGYVEVVGDDVHDLDRDGDGIACDW